MSLVARAQVKPALEYEAVAVPGKCQSPQQPLLQVAPQQGVVDSRLTPTTGKCEQSVPDRHRPRRKAFRLIFRCALLVRSACNRVLLKQ